MKLTKCAHEERFADSFLRCILCERDETIRNHEHGIAEGLRMAAKMFRDSQWKAFKNGVPIHWLDFYQKLMAKAKEVEEAKGEIWAIQNQHPQ
jgi:hypothetical protein